MGIVILGGCVYKVAHGSNQPDEGTEFVIGVSQANLTEPWRVAMNDEIRKEADRHKGLQVIFLPMLLTVMINRSKISINCWGLE
ncbi:hypothetical protein GCM10020331_099190 [Ectobacillus funiculus]